MNEAIILQQTGINKVDNIDGVMLVWYRIKQGR